MQFLSLSFSVSDKVIPQTIDLYVSGVRIDTVSIRDVLTPDGTFTIKGWYDVSGASIADIGLSVSGDEGGSLSLKRVRVDDAVRRSQDGVTLDTGSSYSLVEHTNTRWGFGATETETTTTTTTTTTGTSGSLFSEPVMLRTAATAEPEPAPETASATADTQVRLTFSNPASGLVDRVEVLLDGAVVAASDVAGVHGPRKTFALDGWVAASALALAQLTVRVTGAEGATLQIGRMEIDGASLTAQGRIQLQAGHDYTFDAHGRRADRFVVESETAIAPAEPIVEETPPPAEEPVAETPVEEPAPVVEPVAEEPAPVVEPVAEEPAPVEEPVAETPAEEPVAEEPAPAEEPVAEEPAPAEEPVAEEPAPAEEPVSQEPALDPSLGVYAGQLSVSGDAFSLVVDPSGTPPEGAMIRIGGLPDGTAVDGGVQDEEGRWLLGLDAAGTIAGRLGTGFAGALVLSAAMVSAAGNVLAHSGAVYADVTEPAGYQGIVADGAAIGFSTADLQSIALGLSLSSEALQGRVVVHGLSGQARVVGGVQQPDGTWTVDFSKLADMALVFDGAPAEGTVLRLVAEMEPNSTQPVTPTVQSLVLTQDPAILAALGDAAVEVLEGSVHGEPASGGGSETPVPDDGTTDPVVPDPVVPDDSGTSGGDTSGGGGSGGGDPIQVAMPAPLLDGQTSGVIYAPEVLQAQGPDEVVGLKLQVGQLGEGTSKIVTFGHVFAKGDFQPGDTLVARVGGQELTLQVNAKATHPDGSVRHAILSVEVPQWASGQTLDVMLAKGQPAAQPAALSAADILASGLDMQVRMDFADGTGASVDVAQLLSDAIADGSVKTWLSGPLATEVRFTADVREDFHLSFDVRMLADGSVRTNVQFNYDWLFETDDVPIQYDATITSNGQVVKSLDDVTQQHHTTWREMFGTKQPAPVHTVFDTAYMIESGAIPSYDLAAGADGARIQQFYDAMLAKTGTPGDPGLLNPAMPTAGGRPELGLLPQWAVQYLQSMDQRAYETVIAHGEVAGSVPWHFRDKTTGEAATYYDNPSVWIDYRATQEKNGIDPITYKETGWNPDVPHQPTIAFLPYLLTGDQYYLDQLHAQNAWSVLQYNPGYYRPWYRTSTEGDFVMHPTEVRSYAWFSRELAYAAWITPDQHAHKAYSLDLLGDVIESLNEMFPRGGFNGGALGEIDGLLEGSVANNIFMNDYAAMAFAHIADMGFSDIQELVDWQVNFISGRFTNEDKGFDPMFGAAYTMTAYYHNDPDGIQTPVGMRSYIDTWAEAFELALEMDNNKNNIIQYNNGEFVGYHDKPAHYSDYAKAANAMLFSVTGDVQALEAFGFIVRHTTGIVSQYPVDPTYNLMPTLSDGSVLSNKDVLILGDGSEALTRTDGANYLVLAGGGDDQIVLGDGINLVIGGEGNDTIVTGAGDDYIVGGRGSDRISGGAGNDVMKGGAGTVIHNGVMDTFVFDRGAIGHDRIVDFEAGVDRLEFKAAELPGISSTSDVMNALGTNADGDAVFDFGALGSITLEGVQASQVDQGSILLM